MKQIPRSVFELGSWHPSVPTRDPSPRSTSRPHRLNLMGSAPVPVTVSATGAISRPLHVRVPVPDRLSAPDIRPAHAPEPVPDGPPSNSAASSPEHAPPEASVRPAATEVWRLGPDVAYAMDGRLTHRATGLHMALNDSERRLLEALMVSRTLSKDEVLERVWRVKGIVVSDSSYYKLVSTLRRKFRIVADEQEFIRVIPRLGLELCCPLARTLSEAPCVEPPAIEASPAPAGWLAHLKRRTGGATVQVAGRPPERVSAPMARRAAPSALGRLVSRLGGRLAWSLAAAALSLLLTAMVVMQLRLLFAA